MVKNEKKIVFIKTPPNNTITLGDMIRWWTANGTGHFNVDLYKQISIIKSHNNGTIERDI